MEASQTGSKEERREFMAAFPDICRDITHSGEYSDVAHTTKWLGRVRTNYHKLKKIFNFGEFTLDSRKLRHSTAYLTPSTQEILLFYLYFS